MNESACDARQLKEIIHRLHDAGSSPPSLGEQKQLQNALFTAQQTREAWTYGGQLLSGDDSDVNVRFFGAHTLTIKITRDWHTLSEEHWLDLKEAMLGWLCNSARISYPQNGASAISGERIVLRKLTVALTALSFRLAPDHWPNWLLETLLRLSGSGCSRECTYVILSLVIEEVGRADLIGAKKVKYDQVISDVAPHVSQMISQSLASMASPLQELNAALKCLQSWIPKRDMSRDLLSDLYPLVLQHLPKEGTCVAASSCTEEFLLDMQFATETRVEPLLDFMASSAVGHIFTQAQQEGEIDDVCLALFKLLASVFENAYTLIVKTLQSPRSITILERLLFLTCFPGHHAAEESASEIALPLWSYLQEDVSDNGIVATQSGFGDPRWPTVKGVYEALVNGLLVKVQYPPLEEFRTWPQDIQTAFRTYRLDVGECLINCYYVLRNPMLGKLVELASAQLQLLSQQGMAPADILGKFEATLYCISSIHEAVPEDEDEFLLLLFSGPMLSLLPQIQGSTGIGVKNTVLNVITVYAHWFKTNVPLVLAAVQAIVSCLTDVHVCRAAAMALAALCDSCRKDLVGHVSSFAELVSQLEGRIPDEDYLKILGSVAAVIQALPPAQIVAPTVALVETSISKLAAAMSNPSPEAGRAICMLQLASLTACAKSLAEPEDEVLSLDGLNDATDEATRAQSIQADPQVQRLRSHLTEAVKALSTSFEGDADIAQSLADLLKACTSTNISTPLSLDPLALVAIVSYLVQRDLSAVWLSILSLLTFRAGKTAIPNSDMASMRGSLDRILRAGLGALRAPNALDNNPDIVQSFMDWAMAALTSFPSAFVSMPDATEGLVLLTIEGLTMQERVGLQKAIQLLAAMTNEAAAETQAAVVFRPLLKRHGRSALRLALLGIGGRLPRSNLGYLAELLLAFSKRLPEDIRIWLKELFAEPEFPSRRVSQEQKDRYAKSIASARSLRKLRESTENFAIICRGLEGTSYAGS